MRGLRQFVPVLLLTMVWCVSSLAVEPWDAATNEKLEAQLDVFMSAQTAAAREAQFDAHLKDAGVGLTLAQLEAMRAGGLDLGKAELHGGAHRVAIPWMKGHARGVFNLALPPDYTPTRPWGLVVALHGSGGDVNNMVAFHSPMLNKAGFITLYPQTTDDSQTWDSSEQMAQVLRLVSYVAEHYRVDFRRIVLTGGSMGGMGTWSIASSTPQVWSAGAPVAGWPPLRSDAQFERLRGIPWYILHGDADKNISVEGPRRAAAKLTALKIAHVYVEAAGEGHTPAMKYWQAMNQWLIEQPRKGTSPRPQLLPGAGGTPLWAQLADPLGIGNPDDPVMKLIAAGDQREALRVINKGFRDPKLRDERAKLIVKRAVLRMPALLEPFDHSLSPASFTDAKGWTLSAEKAAQTDLQSALLMRDGKGLDPTRFDALVHVLQARILAAQFTRSVETDRSSVRWMMLYNEAAKHIQAAQKLGSVNDELNPLIAGLKARLPAERTKIIRVPR